MNIYNRGTFGKPAQQIPSKPNDHFQYTSVSAHKKQKRSVGQGIDKQKIIIKLCNLSEQLYQVIFLKESIMSLVGQQRVKMGDFMRELKKYLFQFGVKAERQYLSRQSKGINQSSIIQSNHNSQKIIATNELQVKYDQLLKQNEQLKQKYESMLIHCRQQIQQLSAAMVKPLQKINHTHQSSQLKFLLLQTQQQLKQEQNRFAQKVRYLQTEIMGLQDQYLKEKEMYEKQLDQYRQRQRQLSFQQSELQRKNILLIERQKMLTQRQIISKQERATLQRREHKISDYEHNQLRRQKEKKQQQRQNLRSQYFINYQQDHYFTPHSNRLIDTKTQRQRSTGGRLVNSRIDINARLREIQLQKKSNGTAFKNSRMTQAGMRSERSTSRNKNHIVGYKSPTTRKQATPNVNLKLQSMLQSLQKDLTDMN